MTILILLIIPSLFACLVSTFTVRHFSLPRFIASGIYTFCLLIILNALVFLPLERIHLISVDGYLSVISGKTAPIINMLFGLFTGLFFARCTLDEHVPNQHTSTLPKALALAVGHLLLLFLLTLSQSYIWAKEVYPNANLEEIVFYLRMPLQGTAASFVTQVIIGVIVPAAIGFMILELLVFWPANLSCYVPLKKHLHISLLPLRMPFRVSCLTLLLWFSTLLYTGDQYLDIRSYIMSRFTASKLIETEYVSPSSELLTFPESKRNLITIYIESGETTPQDVANGGILEKNLIPEMTRIANENISFSRSDLLEGASVAPGCGWTIAGLVAQSAGIPLKLYDTKIPTLNDEADNSASTYESLLPGAVTLGDLLAEQGYRNVFMAGSDFTFGGRRVYYSQHGNYEIWDLLTAYETGKLPVDYYEYWGFEDRKLYEYAKDKLSELEKENQPFHFAMLTVDTHAPGYRCPECPTDYINAGRDSLNYADTLRCSSIQLDNFLTWCQSQSFYDNTTIVVTGDHASMQSYFYAGINNAEYDKKHGSNNRLVYNAFINSVATPSSRSNRLFTTMDFFPTVLASMGVQIKGDRLGLGTNLFSETPTLSEEYGEETLFAELNKRSVFYENELLFP